MVNRAMISRQLKRGELYDWLLKLCQCTILSLFRFWFWSSRLIWIFCTLFKFSLYDKYLLKINARQPIEEMLKIKDKNTVQNSGLFLRRYILPVKSSASVFSNDPISMIISYICNFKIKLIIIKVKQLPKIHLDVCVTKAKSMLHTFTKTDMKSSLVELKCFHPKSNKNRNTIISMKQRKIMTASKCRMNSTKMLNCSLIGPTKNLHVKTGVIKILLTIIILHICANSLFFNDLFLKVIHPQNCN